MTAEGKFEKWLRRKVNSDIGFVFIGFGLIGLVVLTLLTNLLLAGVAVLAGVVWVAMEYRRDLRREEAHDART